VRCGKFYLRFRAVEKGKQKKCAYDFPLWKSWRFPIHNGVSVYECVCGCMFAVGALCLSHSFAFIRMCVCACVRHCNSGKTQIRGSEKPIAVEWSNWTPCVCIVCTIYHLATRYQLQVLSPVNSVWCVWVRATSTSSFSFFCRHTYAIAREWKKCSDLE